MVGGGRGIGGGGLVGLGLGVDSGALIGDISDIAVIAVAGVLHVLDSAVGKSNGVGSGHVAVTIGLLLGVEVGLGVVIGNGVGEGVGRNLIGVDLSLVGGGGGVVSRGSVDSVSHDRGGMHGVGDGVGDNHRGVVDGVVSHRVDGVMDGVDGVVDSVVSSIRASSHDGEESSSDESLKLRKLEIFPPKIASYCLLNERMPAYSWFEHWRLLIYLHFCSIGV